MNEPSERLTGTLMADLGFRQTGAINLCRIDAQGHGRAIHQVAAVFNDRWPAGWKKGQALWLTEPDAWGTYRIVSEWRPGSLFAWGVADQDIPRGERGKLRALDAANRETGEIIEAFAHGSAAKAGQVVGLHNCCGNGEWHIAAADDDQNFEPMPTEVRS